jgi:hypothetical protein
MAPPESLAPALTTHIDASKHRLRSEVGNTRDVGLLEEGRRKETSTNVSELTTIDFALKLYIPNNRNATIRFFLDS